MKTKLLTLFFSSTLIAVVLFLYPNRTFSQSQPSDNRPRYYYSWPHKEEAYRISDIPLPPGYSRVHTDFPSFAGWLRDLPLLPAGSPVVYYDGSLKPDQSMHFRVIEMDIGDGDLQQCADALMRLRAEYLFSRKIYPAIHFNFVNGFQADYSKWMQGYRISIQGSRVSWKAKTGKDSSWSQFRRYLSKVYEYANSWSLEQETLPLADITQAGIGDIFLQGGFPGHGVMIVDMAQNKKGEKIFLIAQSYMPAQSIHILKSFDSTSPWYRLDFGTTLQTPTWVFKAAHLRKFKD